MVFPFRVHSMNRKLYHHHEIKIIVSAIIDISPIFYHHYCAIVIYHQKFWQPKSTKIQVDFALSALQAVGGCVRNSFPLIFLVV